jgi:hypothetical protein
MDAGAHAERRRVMTDGRVRSPHPDEEPLEPPRTPGIEEEVEEAPLDDDVDEDAAVPTP